MKQRRPPTERLSIATLQGAALWRALGFKNERAFQRAVQAGRIGIPLYPVPGQSRGWFARVDDVARYRAGQHLATTHDKPLPGAALPRPEAPRQAEKGGEDDLAISPSKSGS